MTDEHTTYSLDEALEQIKHEDPTLGAELEGSNMAYEFARTVIAARRDQGLTQAQLAQRAGITQQKIADIEKMRSNPTLRTIERVCNALGLRAQWPAAS